MAPTNTISVNRAPVLTLWAVVVAERFSFNHAEALTLGRAVAGLNAQSKGRRLGIFNPTEEQVKKAREKEPGERFLIEVCGRVGPVINTAVGFRAVIGREPISPDNVERYLHGKFGDSLGQVRQAVQQLARAYKPRELAAHAYALFEQFRPDIPTGRRDWGATGDLDLNRIVSLAQKP